MSSATELTPTIVSEIVKLARDGQDVTLVDVKGESNGRYYLHVPGREPVLVEPTPKNINDRLASPSELLLYLNGMKDFVLRHHNGEGLIEPKRFIPSDGILIVTDKAIDFRFNFDGAYNRAHVILEKTHEWQKIEALAGQAYTGTALSQTDAYRLFRVDLKSCIPQGLNISKMVREVNWDQSENQQGVIDQAKRNVGMSIVGAATSKLGEFPETFKLELSVYKNFVCPVEVQVDFDPRPEVKKFWITPLPGEIDRAIDKTLSEIRSLFAFGKTDQQAICQAFIGAGGKE